MVQICIRFISKFKKMKKYLVTGGAGFIGSHLSEELSKKAKVVVIDNLFQGNKLKLNRNIKLVRSDIRNKKMIEKYSKGCNAIFHSCSYWCGYSFSKQS